jgi:hypothetical protein
MTTGIHHNVDGSITLTAGSLCDANGVLTTLNISAATSAADVRTAISRFFAQDLAQAINNDCGYPMDVAQAVLNGDFASGAVG